MQGWGWKQPSDERHERVGWCDGGVGCGWGEADRCWRWKNKKTKTQITGKVGWKNRKPPKSVYWLDVCCFLWFEWKYNRMGRESEFDCWMLCVREKWRLAANYFESELNWDNEPGSTICWAVKWDWDFFFSSCWILLTLFAPKYQKMCKLNLSFVFNHYLQTLHFSVLKTKVWGFDLWFAESYQTVNFSLGICGSLIRAAWGWL